MSTNPDHKIRKVKGGFRAICLISGAVADGKTKEATLRKLAEHRKEIIANRVFRASIGMDY